MTRDEINYWLADAYPDHDFLLADGFEDAFVGVVAGIAREPTACYDRARCITILVKRDDMTEEDAEEHFTFNVEGAYVGPTTPAFLVTLQSPMCV